MRASKVSAVILRGMLKFAILVGIVNFRPKTTERGRMEMESCFLHRSCLKCLSVILRLMPLIGYEYDYVLWIMDKKDLVDILLHSSFIGLTVSCYLWILGLQLFHEKPVIELVNKILRLISRVRALPLQRSIEFGDKRELIFIILILLSQVGDFVYMFLSDFSNENIIGWLGLTYVAMSTQAITRINIVWYLYVGAMYAKVNEYASLQMRNLRNPQGYKILEETARLYREIHDIVSSFQDMFNLCLTLCMMQSLLFFVVFSYQMINDLDLYDSLMWSTFAKTLFDLLIICLAVEGAGNQFKGIRQIQSEMCCFEDDKDLRRLVDVLGTQVNLYPFRVSLLGLCEISMELYLKIVFGVICYLIFVIQCVLQIKNSKKYI
ncbi:hypothetical protein KR032_007849 [Drosophila birchii]|nr:hypothetical protein KR032_007849 [Drosophila birchii]